MYKNYNLRLNNYLLQKNKILIFYINIKMKVNFNNKKTFFIIKI